MLKLISIYLFFPQNPESFSFNFFNSLQVSSQIFSINLVMLPVDRKQVDKIDRDYCIKKLSDSRKFNVLAWKVWEYDIYKSKSKNKHIIKYKSLFKKLSCLEICQVISAKKLFGVIGMANLGNIKYFLVA